MSDIDRHVKRAPIYRRIADDVVQRLADAPPTELEAGGINAILDAEDADDGLYVAEGDTLRTVVVCALEAADEEGALTPDGRQAGRERSVRDPDRLAWWARHRAGDPRDRMTADDRALLRDCAAVLDTLAPAPSEGEADAYLIEVQTKASDKWHPDHAIREYPAITPPHRYQQIDGAPVVRWRAVPLYRHPADPEPGEGEREAVGAKQALKA
ncbi:MAG: hypothetical protein ACOC5E_03190, partial [Acidobacteriota bacterium]